MPLSKEPMGGLKIEERKKINTMSPTDMSMNNLAPSLMICEVKKSSCGGGA